MSVDINDVGSCSGPSVVEMMLIFETDVLSCQYKYPAAFIDSKARLWLEQRGRLVLADIINHLKQTPPTKFIDLSIAWGELIYVILTNNGFGCPDPEEVRFIHTDDWVSIAEEFLQADK